jgi:hypothetical protein
MSDGISSFSPFSNFRIIAIYGSSTSIAGTFCLWNDICAVVAALEQSPKKTLDHARACFIIAAIFAAPYFTAWRGYNIPFSSMKATYRNKA